MNKFLLFLFLPLLIQSCNKKEDYKYLTFIRAGQVDGIGIRYVDIVPDEELIKEHYGDTTKNLDLNNDGIDDFVLRHFWEHFMYSSASEMLEITPLGKNSVCISGFSNNWVDSLKYNDTINSNNNWSDSTALLYYYGWHDTSPGRDIIIRGYWYDNDSIYIGVKIVKDNEQLFGWIDMKRNLIRQYAITVPYLEK